MSLTEYNDLLDSLKIEIDGKPHTQSNISKGLGI